MYLVCFYVDLFKILVYKLVFRDQNESDTADTEDDCTWGGLGLYEYSQKGLPHALVHAPELVECGGHHGAYSTSVVETSHKYNIKIPVKFAKTYGSHNKSQDDMLRYVLFEILCLEVIELNEDNRGMSDEPVDDRPKETHLTYKLSVPLKYTRDWFGLPMLRRGQFPRH